jgi:NlpC/P60 family putative phage cell wall peptidase
MSVTRAAIVTEARRWIGTPWHHQAALRSVGADCIGLIAGVADALGMREAVQWRNDLRFRGYGRMPDPKKLIEACSLYLDRLSREPLPGDILLMAFMREPTHFAIVSQEVPRRMIHAYEPIGRVTEHVIDAHWKRRIVAAYAFKGIE